MLMTQIPDRQRPNLTKTIVMLALMEPGSPNRLYTIRQLTAWARAQADRSVEIAFRGKLQIDGYDPIFVKQRKLASELVTSVH